MSKHKKHRSRHRKRAGYHVPQQWLNYAEDDLEFAKHVHEEGEHFHFALFHAQQAAEKALKAFLYTQRLKYDVRFHSLARLIKIGKKFDRDIMRFWKPALRLTRYYSPTRYPDVYPQAKPQELYTSAESEEAIETAEQIINWVRGKI